MFATWSLGGLFLSLGSSIVGTIFDIDSHMVAGLVIGSFFAAGAVGSAAASGWSPNRKLAIGLATLGIGVALSLTGTVTGNVATYVVGAMIAGFGFGSTFVGIIAALIVVTDPAQRGQVFATMFVVSYSAFSIPAVVAGLAAVQFGLRSTAVGYSVFVLILILLAAFAALWRARSSAPKPTGPRTDSLVMAAADTSDTSR
jgi:MFS family permease